MKLELPDNNASVLFHMGNALQSIASDLDAAYNNKTQLRADVSGNTTDSEQYGKSVLGDCLDSIDDLVESFEYERAETIYPDNSKDIAVVTEASDTIDADGLPWDQRIHSRGKTRLDDNTWRMARKPKDKTDEEWAEYVEGVKAELRELMAIPVAVTYDQNEEDPFAIEPPVVIEAPEVVTPPVVIEAPEVVTPPVVDTVVTPPVVDAVVTPPVVDAVVTPPVVDAVVTPPVVDAVVTPPVVDAVVTPPVVDAVVTPPVVDAVVTPPVVDAVVTPPVVDAVDATLMVRPTFEEAVEARGESVKAYVDAVDGLINKINATPPVIATPVATPPVIATPVATGPTTFPELMKFITVNNKKLTKESVDEALKAQGLASIALLAARTDLIPQVHAALVKLL